ncbi:MAG: TonB-dependent receptor, partial [Bacteroidales bacterium]|nr:TonB-dependent receptor [Bacteroidales bacterium]
LVLVDGLPLKSADAEHIKWSFLPLETLSQAEIIKGASSVLYGSSALNGIINLRTKNPGPDPETTFQGFGGFYLKPQRKEIIWWESPRWFAGGSFSHARKINKLDLTVGANIYQDAGYRENEYEKRARFDLKLNQRSKSLRGLSYGINASTMFLKEEDFFLWQNADSGAYRQNLTGTSWLNGFRLYIDPHISYFNEKGAKHSLKTRYFTNTNNYPDVPDKNNHFDQFLGEYKFQKKFSENIRWTMGAYFNYSNVRANLYGNHKRTEAALFTQLSGTLVSRLQYNLGFRWENYWLNDITETPYPVFRAGLNYQALAHTFIRLSAGQGYRFPSIAEKFATTQLGALNIFPNPDLQSETGWSAEIGVMQGYKIGKWTGFLDFAFFRNEYVNMIEYTFGAYPPDSVQIPSLKDIGFKALNVGNARITGIEAIINGKRDFGKLKSNFQIGYTWINPVDLNIQKNDTTNNILKYRFRHSLKGDVNLSWKRISTGATLVYNSFMERVDSVFTDPLIGNLILPGYPEYRDEHQTGSLIIDLRISCQLTEAARLSFIIKNLFNVEYMGRPGDILPHRSITLQFLLKI